MSWWVCAVPHCVTFVEGDAGKHTHASTHDGTFSVLYVPLPESYLPRPGKGKTCPRVTPLLLKDSKPGGGIVRGPGRP